MNPMQIELIGPVNFYLGMGLKVLSAIFLGGLIGLERERKMKAAGIRTNMMICLGATMYVSVSFMTGHLGTVFDPNRIAAQVVSGIGFICAGSIIRGKGNVLVGLTTAATIWVVAAIGVTIGAGFPLVAGMFTFTILAVLRFMGPLIGLIEPKRYCHVEILSLGSVKSSVGQIMLARLGQIPEMTEEKAGSGEELILHAYLHLNPKVVSEMMMEIEDVARVKKAHSYITNKPPHELKNVA